MIDITGIGDDLKGQPLERGQPTLFAARLWVRIYDAWRRGDCDWLPNISVRFHILGDPLRPTVAISFVQEP